VWRDRYGNLPTDFWWALAVSLLLHLFLLELGLASSRPEGARKQGGIALHATLLGAPPHEFVSVPMGDPLATGGAIAEDSDQEPAVQPVAYPVPAAARQTTLNDELIRRPSHGPVMPIEIDDSPVPTPVSGSVSYFRRSELTRPPVLLGEPLFDAPDEPAKAPTQGGKLSLRLFVSASGELDRAEVERSASRADLEDAAIAAFLPLHFLPAQIDGVAVNSQVVFEIDFDSQAGGSSRSSDRASWLAGAVELGDGRGALASAGRLPRPGVR